MMLVARLTSEPSPCSISCCFNGGNCLSGGLNHALEAMRKSLGNTFLRYPLTYRTLRDSTGKRNTWITQSIVHHPFFKLLRRPNACSMRLHERSMPQEQSQENYLFEILSVYQNLFGRYYCTVRSQISLCSRGDSLTIKTQNRIRLWKAKKN